MSEPTQGQSPPDAGQQQQQPPEGTGGGDQQESIEAVLAELGVEADGEGRVSLAEHKKLLATLRSLRERVRTNEVERGKAVEAARLASLGETEREIEKARSEGYEKAKGEASLDLRRSQVIAAAASAGFRDPADALGHVDVSKLDDEGAVKAAVATLAKQKTYLLRTQGAGPKLEPGPQGSSGNGSGSADWLGDAMRKRRVG